MDHCRNNNNNNNNNKQDRMENEIAWADEVIENEMDREVKTFFFFLRNERLRLKIDTMKHVFIFIYFFMPCKVVIKQIWS